MRQSGQCTRLALDIPCDERVEQTLYANSAEHDPLNENPVAPNVAAPFVKWAGGKRSIIAELTRRLPPSFGDYYEPFAGGAALFFECHNRLNRAVLSDTNFGLVVTFNVVKKDPISLIRRLEEHALEHSEAYYYRVRGQHRLQESLDIAARFIYLNKTCYNGLYRVNSKDEFNVPIGRYVNPDIVQKERLLACNRALRNASIYYREFDSISPKSGDFVYCDPPYHPASDLAFTKYTKLDFSEKDQERLRNFAVQLHKAGVLLMLSNSDTPFIRSLYNGPMWRIATIQAPRYVNCKANGRGAVNELIITNYTP